MSENTMKKLLDGKIVAIVRGIDSQRIVGLAKALAAGGITCIEVTFDQSVPDKLQHTLDAIAALVSSVNQSNISAYIQDYILIINKIILQHSQALNACFRHLAWVMTKYKRSFPKRTFAPLLESVFKTYEPYFQQENCKKWELLAIEKDVAEASLMQLAVIYESWGYNCFFGQAYRPWYIKV
jgi:hypothetical protein